MKSFSTLVPRRYEKNIKTIQQDGETSRGNGFNAWAAETEIILECSAPYTPTQNEAAERSGKELIQKARAMEIDSNIPEELGPETVKTAGYLHNQTSNRL